MTLPRKLAGAALISASLVFAVLAWPAGALAGPFNPTTDQSATSAGAVWMQDHAGSGMCYGYYPDSLYGGGVKYMISFVIPGEVLEASGPTGKPGEADLRKPWVSFVERHGTPPEGCGSGWFEDVYTICSTFTNPDYEWTVGEPGSAPNGRDRSARLSVDVPCEDGRGYDFYRWVWEGHINSGGNVLSAVWGWGDTEPGGWTGGTHRLSAPIDRWTGVEVSGEGTFWAKESRFCPHDDEGFHCDELRLATGDVNIPVFHAYAQYNAP